MNFFTTWLARVRKQRPGHNFTPRAKQALALGRRVAAGHQGEGVEAEHLLVGLLWLNRGIGVLALKKAGIDPQQLKSAVERSFVKGAAPVEAIKLPYQKSVKLCLALALREAETLRNRHCGTEHLLLGIIHHGEGAAAEALRSRGFTLERAREVTRVVQAEAAAEMPDSAPDPTAKQS